MRIGELSRRVGVGIDTLRAWERRYGVLVPERSDGNFRLYDEADEHRAREMQALIVKGSSAREAARAVMREVPIERAFPAGSTTITPSVDSLLDAIKQLDAGAANAILDQAFAALSFDGAARQLILPALRALGDRWERGEVTIGQEHFASNLLRGRLLALAQGWHAGGSQSAVLACPPGEHHDLGLIVFGLALNGKGWRVVFLGANTPIATIAETAGQADAELVVIESLDPAPLRQAKEELLKLADARMVGVGGSKTATTYAEELGLVRLDGDPVEEAGKLARRSNLNS